MAKTEDTNVDKGTKAPERTTEFRETTTLGPSAMPAADPRLTPSRDPFAPTPTPPGTPSRTVERVDGVPGQSGSQPIKPGVPQVMRDPGEKTPGVNPPGTSAPSAPSTPDKR